MKYYDIVGKRNWLFALSLIIIATGITFGIIKGPKLDIDFIGGTVINITLNTNAFNIADIQNIVTEKTGIPNPQILTTGINNTGVSIRTAKALSPDENKAIFEAIKAKYNLTQNDPDSVDTIEPLIGKELRNKGLLAVGISSVLILGYVAFMFRKMGGLAAGVTSIAALVHDILILLSVYLIAQIPMNIAFIAAALTILGYSMNDTIIVYDRIRENEKLLRKVPVPELVNRSILQTLGRTINTVLTVLITVTTLYIFGVVYNVEQIKEFTLPLLIGIVSGSYSSVFVASSLYVVWNEFSKKKAKETKAQA